MAALTFQARMHAQHSGSIHETRPWCGTIVTVHLRQSCAHAQEENTFDSAVDATVELIFCTSAGGVPHQHQLPLAQRLVQAVSPMLLSAVARDGRASQAWQSVACRPEPSVWGQYIYQGNASSACSLISTAWWT